MFSTYSDYSHCDIKMLDYSNLDVRQLPSYVVALDSCDRCDRDRSEVIIANAGD